MDESSKIKYGPKLLQFWLGFELLLTFSVCAFSSSPTVSYTIESSGAGRMLIVSGLSIGDLQSAVITVQFDSIDISRGMLTSSIPALQLGAAFDSIDHVLRIYLSAAKPLSIDNTTLVTVSAPVTGNMPVMYVREVSITDSHGETHIAQIIPSVGVAGNNSRNKAAPYTDIQTFLLNGRRIPLKIQTLYNVKYIRNFIPLRMVKIRK